MHVLDISTKIYRDIHSTKKNKYMVDKFYDDIKRAIRLQTNCQIEYNGWHIDAKDNKVHVEIIILSNDPVTIKKVCEIIEHQKNLSRRSLVFLK